MKKEKLVVKCSQEEFFNALVYDFKNQYLRIKEKELNDDEIVQGFSFTHKLPMRKRDTVVNKATYKVAQCVRPEVFVLEYTSKTYHKVISAQTKALDNSSIEVLFGTFDEKLGIGIKATVNFGEDEIKKAGLKTKFKLKSMLKTYRKEMKEINN